MPKIPQNAEAAAKEHTRGAQRGDGRRFGANQPHRVHVVGRCQACIDSILAQSPGPSIAVAPGSGLERLLGLLKRGDQRLLLAAIQTTNPKRKARMERDFQRRAARVGVAS